jgi:hypothetical protein
MSEKLSPVDEGKSDTTPLPTGGMENQLIDSPQAGQTGTGPGMEAQSVTDLLAILDPDYPAYLEAESQYRPEVLPDSGRSQRQEAAKAAAEQEAREDAESAKNEAAKKKFELEELGRRVTELLSQIEGTVTGEKFAQTVPNPDRERLEAVYLRLTAASRRASNPSSSIEPQDRMTLLETTRIEAEAVVSEAARLLDDGQAYQNLSEITKTAIDQFTKEISAAKKLRLKAKSADEQRLSLLTDFSLATDESNDLGHGQRMGFLGVIKRRAEASTLEMQGLVAAATEANNSLLQLTALIDKFDQQFPDADCDDLVEKLDALSVRMDTAGTQDAIYDINFEALEAVIDGKAAFGKQPVASEIRKRVDAPLKTLRRDLAVLKTTGRGDTEFLDGYIAEIESDLTRAGSLRDKNQAALDAAAIAELLQDAQSMLDAEKAKSGVADMLRLGAEESLENWNAVLERLVEFNVGISFIAAPQDWTQRLDAANQIKDPKERFEALARAKQAVDEAVKRAESLAEEAKRVTGDSARQATDTQKPAIYKAAMEKLYGLKIEIPDEFSNAYLDKVFDVFAMVPMEFVAHGRLKKLKYDAADDKAGVGSYLRMGATITMGKFGESKTDDYKIGDKDEPVNSFKVTTMHEIGHSVDTLHGIMAAAMRSAGNGGWQAHAVDDIVPIFVSALKGTTDLPQDIDVSVLTGAVAAALKSGAVERPDGVSDPNWTGIEAFLKEKCLASRFDKTPWFNSEPGDIKVGDRVYHESAANKWFSYDAAARETSFVSKYQWRSPGEWFSELFAITWFKKTKPPSGVGAAITKYLWPPPGTT